MTTQPDLGPAVRRMVRLVEGVSDDDLDRPTPCPDYSVGDLLDHIRGGALAFGPRAKSPLDGAPSGDAARLGARLADPHPP